MKKYDTWCLKNKLLSFIIHTILSCGVVSVIMIALEAPVAVIVILDLFLVFSSYARSNFSYAKALQNAVISFENCCPQPLYDLVEEIKPYVKGTELQQIILNQTSALYCMGRHDEMLEILENENIDKYVGQPLQYKILYYNNLATVYEIKGDFEKARAVFKKLKMLISDAKPKIKQQFYNQMTEADIFEAKLAGDYHKALELCFSRQNDKMIQKADNAYTAAEIYLAMGDIENAKNCLFFVKFNGGSTFLPGMAEQKLFEIESKN